MSVIDLIMGTHVLLVGVEDQDDGALRCYIDSRHRGLYVLVDDPAAQAQVRSAWATGSGHLTIPKPPADCIYRDDDSAER